VEEEGNDIKDSITSKSFLNNKILPAKFLEINQNKKIII